MQYALLGPRTLHFHSVGQSLDYSQLPDHSDTQLTYMVDRTFLEMASRGLLINSAHEWEDRDRSWRLSSTRVAWRRGHRATWRPDYKQLQDEAEQAAVLCTKASYRCLLH